MLNMRLTLKFNGINLLFVFAVCARFMHVDSADCPEVKNKEETMFKINSMCYHFISTPDVQVTFDTAQPDCVSRGGHLVTIKDNVTQDELTGSLQKMADSHTVLIGLRKQGQIWKWVTGETLAYSNWEGPACRDCNCAKLKLKDEGMWESFNCLATDWFTAYVCEYDTIKSSAENIHPAKWTFLSVLSTFTATLVVLFCL